MQKGPTFCNSTGRLFLNNKKTGHPSVLLSYILGDVKRGLKFSPLFLVSLKPSV